MLSFAKFIRINRAWMVCMWSLAPKLSKFRLKFGLVGLTHKFGCNSLNTRPIPVHQKARTPKEQVQFPNMWSK